jgi:nitroreductase
MTDADEFLDILRTNRAMRRLRPDPLPDDLVRRVLEAATWAPSGSNRQDYVFVAVRDRSKIARLGELRLQEWNGSRLAAARDRMDPSVEKSATRGSETLGQAPVIVVVANIGPIAGHSIFPAVQNLLLAARVLGLGGYITMIESDEAKNIVGLPPEASIAAVVPLGRPAGSFGPVRRRPLDEIVFWDEWRER